MEHNQSCAVYHEKQSRELCALHALNNLFQEATLFKKQDLDDICMTLSPSSSILNPHRSMIGLGNYDVNVVIAALQTKDCETIWFDKRKNVEELILSKIQGFILNIPSDLSLGFIHIPIKRKHWIAVTKVEDVYYNLDSKLDLPKAIGNEAELRTYLKEQISSKDKEILIVVKPRVERGEIWASVLDKGDVHDKIEYNGDICA